MTELFEKIIIGEKDIEEIEKENAKTEKAKRTTEVATYFLKIASQNYKNERIKSSNVKKVIGIYENLLKDNKTVKDYINSNEEVTLKDAEHIIKLFVDDYVKSTLKGNIWTRPLNLNGWVEPLILSLITIIAGAAILGQIYLRFY